MVAMLGLSRFPSLPWRMVGRTGGTAPPVFSSCGFDTPTPTL